LKNIEYNVTEFMLSIKLINNLKKLDKRKLNDFEKFLSSPFFLKRSQLPLMFAEIKKYLPGYDVSKKILFSKAFNNKPYNEVLMRKYQSELNRMLEQYFVVSNLLNDDFEFKSLLAKVKRNYGELEELGSISGEAIDMLEKFKKKNHDYYFYKYIFNSYRDISRNQNYQGINDIFGNSTVSSFLDYSAITVLKYYSKILNNMKVFKLSVNIKVLDEISELFHRNKMIVEPAALIYYNIIQLQKDPLNETFYFRIKAMLKKYEEQTENNEMRGFYTFLHNYCYERIDKGSIKFVKERFEIMQQFMANGYCYVKGFMRAEFFSSMVLTLLTLKKLSMAEEFISKNGNTLQPETRLQQLYFANANLFMHKKNYNKSLEYLSKLTGGDIFDKLRVKALYLMVYYEAGMYDTALYNADAFRKFILNNKKITGFVYERNMNFIKQCLAMVKYRTGTIKRPDIKRFEKKTIMNRLWLMKKIKELK